MAVPPEAEVPGAVSRASRRFYRTLLLGLAAMGVLVWAAVDQFGISLEEMAGLFLGTVWVVGGTIACAAVFVFLWMGLRRWLHRGDAD